MRPRLEDRNRRFTVEDGCLIRTVVGGKNGGYTHRCCRKAFETVAHALGETPAAGKGTTLEEISQREDLAFTQVNVALEFLKERGIAAVRHRRCYPAASTTFEDAMVEFLALAEGEVKTD